MAKSARSSSKKANNQRLKKNVFGPVEAARAERLSSRLLELAAQPKPDKELAEAEMEDAPAAEAAVEDKKLEEAEDKIDEMDVDVTKGNKKKVNPKKRIEKRRSRKSSIVFPKYKDKNPTKKKK